MHYIVEKAKDIAEKYGGKDIFETAEISGVKVWFRPLGRLKGFYMFENNCRYIVINEDLDDITKAIVCAHELGHDMLHRELSAGGIRENTLFLDNNKTEREANLFAAEILISDESILSALSFCDSESKLSAELRFPEELIKFKLEIMNEKGCNFNFSDAKSDFLK